MIEVGRAEAKDRSVVGVDDVDEVVIAEDTVFDQM